MSREMLIALAGGAISGAAVGGAASMAATLGLLTALLLAYLAPLPVMAAGLSQGPRAVTVAAICGFMMAGLLGGAMAAGLYGLIHGLPSWLVVRQALLQRPTPDGGRDWYPVGAIVCWLSALAACLFVVAAALTNLSAETGIKDAVSSYLDAVIAHVQPEFPAANRDQVVAVLAPFFPAEMAGSWMLMVILNAVLAQSLLSRSGRALRPSPAFSDLELPQWASWPLVAAAAVALIGPGEVEYIGRNLAMILAMPFFFLGLAVVHALVRRLAFPAMALVVFYLLLLLTGWPVVLVAGIGVVEQWAGVRRRFAAPGTG